MDIDKFYEIDLERDIKILLAHYRHNQQLGQGSDDILNAVFVGSVIKGRLLLDMMGIKADHKNNSIKLSQIKKGDINSSTIGGRLANSSDIDGNENLLFRYLTSVNKAEAHRDGYDINNDEAFHPGTLLILNLVNKCMYKPTGRQIKFQYARTLLELSNQG
jgi:hypothetical protein